MGVSLKVNSLQWENTDISCVTYKNEKGAETNLWVLGLKTHLMGKELSYQDYLSLHTKSLQKLKTMGKIYKKAPTEFIDRLNPHSCLYVSSKGLISALADIALQANFPRKIIETSVLELGIQEGVNTVLVELSYYKDGELTCILKRRFDLSKVATSRGLVEISLRGVIKHFNDLGIEPSVITCRGLYSGLGYILDVKYL